ncbi:sigma-54 interaction domain-containing protein [Halomonas getboli]|uniref:sigma-54 interaction domain-containing protein n=1 Tax=Halomonas getboli TaxID=2935862 RepID=UPI001FFF15D7|nr:sigma-54 dependent transcriptional regulator [Halomonas getboli]MCK2185028.1 sigma-54 dependent transcriptional regulator [Halomonas getboli]
MKAEENLLFIGKDTEEENTIMDELKERGWGITSISNIRNIKGKRLPKHHDIGVIFLTMPYLEDASIFENITNGIDVRLIAVVDETVLKDIKRHQSIARLFFGFHLRPVDIDRLHYSLENLLSIIHMEQSLQESVLHPSRIEGEMVGNSRVMKALFKAIHKVAAVDAPVLIQGESGTGKELAAKAIHGQSSRNDAPFNAINCGALPANLIQSELFGHEKGSFTGATQRKIGIIEHSDGGTLFLDEIGDLPLDMQVNLLRFLENSTIQRVGGLKEIQVDLRVLAATHIDLEKAVEEGRFREDLYHRLNVLQIQVPSLRDRGEDITTLAHYFFKKFSGEKPLIVNGFSKESLSVMLLYEWPGNIRELINRVRRAMVMSEHPLIRPADLGLERRHSTSRYASSLEEARDQAERSVVMASLTRNTFNIQNAARELGISRVTLYRLMEKHQIQRKCDSKGEDDKENPKIESQGKILAFTGLSKGKAES